MVPDCRVIQIVEGDYESLYFVNLQNQWWYLLDIPQYTKFRRDHPGITVEMRTVHIALGEWKQVTQMLQGFETSQGYECGITGVRRYMFEDCWTRAYYLDPSIKEEEPMLHSYNAPDNAPVKALMLFKKTDKPDAYNGYERDVFLYNSVDGITRLNFRQFLTMVCLKHSYDLRFTKLQESEDWDALLQADYNYFTSHVTSMDTKYKDASVYDCFRHLWHRATMEVMPK